MGLSGRCEHTGGRSGSAHRAAGTRPWKWRVLHGQDGRSFMGKVAAWSPFVPHAAPRLSVSGFWPVEQREKPAGSGPVCCFFLQPGEREGACMCGASCGSVFFPDRTARLRAFSTPSRVPLEIILRAPYRTVLDAADSCIKGSPLSRCLPSSVMIRINSPISMEFVSLNQSKFFHEFYSIHYKNSKIGF